MPQVRTVSPDGERIRELRLSQGLSARQLAARIPGRHPKTIQQLESGRIEKASELLIHQLAIALGTQADALIKAGEAA